MILSCLLHWKDITLAVIPKNPIICINMYTAVDSLDIRNFLLYNFSIKTLRTQQLFEMLKTNIFVNR